jgi:hypothetical protein
MDEQKLNLPTHMPITPQGRAMTEEELLEWELFMDSQIKAWLATHPEVDETSASP